MSFSRKRTVGLGIFLFFLIIVALGLYLFNIRDSLGSKKPDELIAKADKSEKRATAIIDGLKEAMEIDPIKNLSEVKRRYMETDAEANESLEELESAISSLEDLSDLNVSSWQKNYADLRIQSISRRIKMLDVMGRWFSQMELVVDFLRRTTSAQQKFDLGIEKLDQAIENANDKDYDKAKANASKGKQLFDEAQKLLQEASGMEKDAGLDSILNTVASAQDFASLTIQLAEAGASDEIEEYNDIAQKCEDAKANVLKEWDAETIKEPEKWYSKKNRKLEQSMNNYEQEVAQLRDNAKQLYKKNSGKE